jgi:hypothetical protein
VRRRQEVSQVPKSRKERAEGKKKKPWQMSKERRKQLLALFLVLLMIGSALVLMVTYAY